MAIEKYKKTIEFEAKEFIKMLKDEIFGENVRIEFEIGQLNTKDDFPAQPAVVRVRIIEEHVDG